MANIEINENKNELFIKTTIEKLDLYEDVYEGDFLPDGTYDLHYRVLGQKPVSTEKIVKKINEIIDYLDESIRIKME